MKWNQLIREVIRHSNTTIRRNYFTFHVAFVRNSLSSDFIRSVFLNVFRKKLGVHCLARNIVFDPNYDLLNLYALSTLLKWLFAIVSLSFKSNCCCSWYTLSRNSNFELCLQQVFLSIRTFPQLEISPTDTSSWTNPRLTLPRRTFPRTYNSPNGHFPSRDFPRPEFFPTKTFPYRTYSWPYALVRFFLKKFVSNSFLSVCTGIY